MAAFAKSWRRNIKDAPLIEGKFVDLADEE
jgi:hypothetical protein